MWLLVLLPSPASVRDPATWGNATITISAETVTTTITTLSDTVKTAGQGVFFPIKLETIIPYTAPRPRYEAGRPGEGENAVVLGGCLEDWEDWYLERRGYIYYSLFIPISPGQGGKNRKQP